MYSIKIPLFWNIIPEYTGTLTSLSHPGRTLKFRRGKNRDMAFAAVHEQPFPALENSGMGQDSTQGSCWKLMVL